MAPATAAPRRRIRHLLRSRIGQQPGCLISSGQAAAWSRYSTFHEQPTPKSVSAWQDPQKRKFPPAPSGSDAAPIFPVRRNGVAIAKTYSSSSRPNACRRKHQASHAAAAASTPDTSAVTSHTSPSRPGSSHACTSSLITAWAANTAAGHQRRTTSMASRVGAAKPKKCSSLSEFGNHSEAPGSPGVYRPYR